MIEASKDFITKNNAKKGDCAVILWKNYCRTAKIMDLKIAGLYAQDAKKGEKVGIVTAFNGKYEAEVYQSLALSAKKYFSDEAHIIEEDNCSFLEEIKRKVYFGQLSKQDILKVIKQAERDRNKDTIYQ